MPNIQKQTLRNLIQAENEAIFAYSQITPDMVDGTEFRSIEHILQEEKDHRAILIKMLEKRLQEPRKEKLLVAFQK
jgi:rubrerythrin